MKNTETLTTVLCRNCRHFDTKFKICLKARYGGKPNPDEPRQCERFTRLYTEVPR